MVTATLAVVLLCLSLPSLAQPLIPGVSSGNEQYFLDEGKVRVLTANGSLTTRDPGAIGELEQVLQPDGWDGAILVKGKDGIAILQGQASKVFDFKPSQEPDQSEESDQSQESGEQQESGEEPKFFFWGDKVAWVIPGEDQGKAGTSGQKITWATPSKSKTIIEPEKITGEIKVYGESLLYLTEAGHYKLYSSQNPEQSILGKLPFPVADARIAVAGNRAIIWAPGSKEVVRPNAQETMTLPQFPELGAYSTAEGGIVLGAVNTVMYFAPDGTLQSIHSPMELTEEDFIRGRFFEHRGRLFFLGKRGEELRLQGLGATSTGLVLAQQEVKGVFLPPEHPALLLTETSTDETRVHDSGKVVIDPKTREKATHSVKGFKLFRLGNDASWTEIMNDQRAKLVGPAQRLGDRLIFATQNEPPNEEGVKRNVDGRYPYPKVVIHAVDLSSGTEVWTLDLPRGESPSLARLPDSEEWPIWGVDGPLLFTTEDDRLAALDLQDGKVLWVSEWLPLDESRPGMVAWESTLGLAAVKNTTKSFLVFDRQGKLVESIRLNDLFNHARTLNLIGVVVICLALILYIYLAGKKKLFIRRIAGLEALDEAVGRSTEMGKPVLYVTGLADVDDIQTLAALSILSHVAKKTAEYDTQILATTSRAVTFSAAQEVVRDAFTIAGRPDSFSVESVRYISDDQFGYAAGVDGLMVREKPAANFYMGKFYAESLIFAETGNATGAIQIAGTAQANQLPFFVAACDYTLIGEELFAASAYLSGDPLQVGSLRGQDVGKAIVMVILVVLSVDATFGGRLTFWLGQLIGVSA